jgi:hypothetical protein
MNQGREWLEPLLDINQQQKYSYDKKLQETPPYADANEKTSKEKSH